MTLTGRVFSGRKIIFAKSVSDELIKDANFHDRLETCLLGLCKEADIPAPMWLSKNSTELSRFGKTDFHSDQFPEKVGFDRFEIKIANR